ncbi:MAG: hypothetical protein IJ826_02365 [Bacteroidaceae bacterium]|nr:hypothetical protein [Bacteroidaceae bacterium]
MIVTSKFNSRGIKVELMLFLVAAFAMVGGPMMRAHNLGLVTKLIVVSIAEVVALLIWAIRLRVITVVDQGFEVRRVCFPFLKRFYRFAEFDFYVVEQKGEIEHFHLLRQGERTVSFSTRDYENYEDLKSLLSVVGTKEWSVDYNRAVDSVFKKIPLVMIFFFLILTLFMASFPFIDYFFNGHVIIRSHLFPSVIGLLFFSLPLYGLYTSRLITIWRGNIEVRSLLCPWKVRCYSLKDFDYALEVLTPGQYGSGNVSLWLIRDDKLVLNISQDLYANYDVLSHAIGIMPSQTVTFKWLQVLKYGFGKRIQI